MRSNTLTNKQHLMKSPKRFFRYYLSLILLFMPAFLFAVLLLVF
ncbi:MAG: hypothetical protein O9353_04050 [Bacteroidia bacterium]|nr:hypothetical protein [Bacteroidia bacterium]